MVVAIKGTAVIRFPNANGITLNKEHPGFAQVEVCDKHGVRQFTQAFVPSDWLVAVVSLEEFDIDAPVSVDTLEKGAIK